MEIGKLIEWNPWWDNTESINSLVGIHRPDYDSLINSVNIREVTIITGVRRSGKSTLMYQMIKNLLGKGVNPEQILFINLEDTVLTNENLEEIYFEYRKQLNPDKKAYIFLDEIHKREDWEKWIRKKYDLKTSDKFIISGSSSYLLKKEYSSLLTGRNLTFEVFPLGFKEFLLFKDFSFDKNKFKKGIIPEKDKMSILRFFSEYLNNGGFPEIELKSKEFKLKLLKQYFDDILYKDIIYRHNLNSNKSKDLALYFITNFTKEFSLRKIRGSLGISYDLIKDYLSYFTEAFIFSTLDYFSYSLKNQKSFPSKVYCIDNGLRNAVSFKFSKDEGKLAENIVFLELKRRDLEIYYWKNEKGNEIDFVVKRPDNSLELINVSYSGEIEKRELIALKDFSDKFDKVKKKTIITKDLEKNENGTVFIPLWKWLLQL